METEHLKKVLCGKMELTRVTCRHRNTVVEAAHRRPRVHAAIWRWEQLLVLNRIGEKTSLRMTKDERNNQTKRQQNVIILEVNCLSMELGVGKCD